MNDDRGNDSDRLATPARHERRATLMALATIAAGPTMWLLQLWLLALIGDIPCRAPDASGPVGIGVEDWWWLVSGVTALVATVSLMVAIRMRGDTEPDEQGLGEDRTIGFLSTLGAWSSALFLATILLGATAPLFLDCP